MSIADLFVQRKIQDGNIEEFERLFLKYYTPLCRHAYGIVNDMDTAEDIVQDFFYNFWKNRESIVLKLSLNAYMYQAVRNNSLQYVKRKSLHLSKNEDLVKGAGELCEEAGTQLEFKELNAVVQTTLQKLPTRCANIFKLNRFEGKRYMEIAQILSISVKTVEADMGKALNVFRHALSEYNSDKPGR